MNSPVPAKFSHPLSREKFLISSLRECPESYLRHPERDEFFEMVWHRTENNQEKKDSITLTPPFRWPQAVPDGINTVIIAFKREYLEEDDKEYALDVFRLFNLQEHTVTLTVDQQTSSSLNLVHLLLQREYSHDLSSFLVVKALLKVFLLHLIRLNQKTFLNQDVNQKRVYEISMLVDQNYHAQRKASFYAGQLGITEKRLNQILKEKLGKTITELIHARLVLEAKRKLASSESTIKEIAYELQFEGHSYFSRFFKKQTGLTPEDFKKQVSGSDC